jgi:hypothetical protein
MNESVMHLKIDVFVFVVELTMASDAHVSGNCMDVGVRFIWSLYILGPSQILLPLLLTKAERLLCPASQPLSTR